MPDQDGGYRFWHERAENQPVPIAVSDDLEPRLQLDDQLKILFHEVLLVNQSKEQRKYDLEKLEEIIFSTAENLKELKKHTPTILRLSVLCPFESVRKKMREILDKLQTKCRNKSEKDKPEKAGKRRKLSQSNILPHARVTQPSSYVYEPLIDFNCTEKQEKILNIVDDDEDYRQTLDESERRKVALLEHWRTFHRIDHLALVLSMHVTYFELWRKYMQVLFDADNIGLPRIERIYIAIMASAARQSSYLYYFLREEFMNDLSYDTKNYKDWLNIGYDSLPEKFKALSKLNEKLAARPWEVTAEDISQLSAAQGSAWWRDSDLIYAIIIMAWFHSMAGLCFGIGINPEIDAKVGHTFRPPSSVFQDEAEDSENSEDAVDGLVSQMERITRERTESQSRSDFDPAEEKEKNQKGFYSLISERDNDLNYYSIVSSDDDTDDENLNIGEMNKYLTRENRNGVQSKQLQSLPKHSDTAILKLQEYDWISSPTTGTDNAHDFISAELSTICPDLVPLIDQKFEHMQNLTYEKMGAKQQIDTKIFRNGIWDYANCLLGIMTEDIPYYQLEKLVRVEWREYLKNLILYPTKVTRKQYDTFCSGLGHDEKVHVNIICLEARFQAELLYSMRAFGESSRLRPRG